MKTLRDLVFLMFVFAAAGCARQPYVFKDAEPVQTLDDRKPTALPSKTDYEFIQLQVTSSVRDPLTGALDPRRNPRAGDVNALDEVPASTWFQPRLGYQNLSPEEIVKGPEISGMPEKPFTVIKAKKKGNTPGFLVKDARGKKYLLKFDSADFPGGESTANYVSNRLFWAFGYNVPEDYTVRFKAADLKDSAESGVTEDDIQSVLLFSVTDKEGNYVATASGFIDGKILGSIPQTGTRRGDPNDKIPHEHLRILRAMRVFSAFTDHSGMRADNTLDTYVGEEGKGYTVHYLVDFGETFGMHGAGKQALWDGYDHIFSFKEMALSYMGLGFRRKQWEGMTGSLADSKTFFESDRFDFYRWKEATQYRPIRLSRPEDDYWAAKILGSLQESHLAALFKASGNSDTEGLDYLLATLMKRREKILGSVFLKVSPLESRGIKDGKLQIEDRGEQLLPSLGKASYEVKFFNRKNRKIAETQRVTEGPLFSVAIPESLLSSGKGYARIEISASRHGKTASPAEFHLRGGSDGKAKLAGIVH